MNAVMRRSMCVVMLLLVVARAAIAQDLLTISGVVTTRADGMPVPGATVSIVGADASATSDASGSYTLQAPRARAAGNRIQLKVSALGLPAKLIDVAIEGKTVTADVALTLEFRDQVTVGSRAAGAVAEKAVPVDVITHDQIVSSGYAETAQIMPLRVGIHLRVDQSIVSRRLTGRLKDETEAIWGQYGIQLEWTDAGASEPAVDSVSLDATVERRFEAPERKAWATVLGDALVRPDAPSWQPIRVSFEATESVLRKLRPSGGGLVRDHELARALGRVLAHEIGHVLLAAPYHDRAGLMRAAFRADQLAEPNRAPFRLTCGSVGRLRSRLRVLTGEPQLCRQHGSTLLDLEGSPGTSEESSAASCIAIQPAR